MTTIHENGSVAPDDVDAPSSNGIESGLKLWADVGLEIGNKLEAVTSRLERIERERAKLQYSTPVDYATIASGSFVTGTPLVLNLGSPDLGTYWEVTGVSIGGQEINVTAAGTAGIYVSGLPTLAGAGMTNLQSYVSSMPASQTFGTRQLVVKSEEYLFAIVFGGTNGLTYVAGASMTVFNYGAARGNVEIAS